MAFCNEIVTAIVVPSRTVLIECRMFRPPSWLVLSYSECRFRWTRDSRLDGIPHRYRLWLSGWNRNPPSIVLRPLKLGCACLRCAVLPVRSEKYSEPVQGALLGEYFCDQTPPGFHVGVRIP